MEMKPGLNRAIGPWTAILLVISSMIGSGIFKKIAPMSTVLGDGNLILLAWIFAGIISMFGAFSYAGLASLTEEGGGQFEYFRIIYGKFFAFLFGWTCFTVIQTASIASIAFVFAESVNNLYSFRTPFDAFVDYKLPGGILPFFNSGIKLYAIGTIILLSVINYFGVKKGGVLNDIFSAAKIAGIIILIVAGLTSDHSTASTLYSSESTLQVPEGRFLLSAMFTAMLAAFWAYDGWINIAYIGGEVKNPKKNIPIAIIAGTAIVMCLYVLLNEAYLRALPVNAYATIDAGGTQIAGAEMAQSILGNSGYVLITVLIMVCTFGATNASLMSSPRIYFQMANRSLFFRSFGAIHPKYHTPHKSILFQGIWAVVLVISGTFNQLTDMLIFASFIAYGSGAAGLVYMKWKGKKNAEGKREKIKVKVFGYPVIPILFVLFCIGLVINTIITSTSESLIGLGFIAAGIPMYFIVSHFNKSGK